MSTSDSTKSRNRSRTKELEELWEQGEIGPSSIDASFIDTLTPRELGEVGELLAMSYLEERGYTVLEHHYRCPDGEADLIVLDEADGYIVLVEVKTRRTSSGDGSDLCPEEAVDAKKQKRYKRIARHYACEQSPVYALRFDVISIIVRCGCVAELIHLHDAFDWEVGR